MIDDSSLSPITITNKSQKRSNNRLNDDEIRMKWFMLYFMAGLSTILIATTLLVFFITKSPLVLTGFSQSTASVKEPRPTCTVT